MRVLSLFVLLVYQLNFAQENGQEFLSVVSKEITVQGNSSVGKFNCRNEQQTKDTLFIDNPSGLSGKIEVRDFTCGNFLIKHDFRKTLNAKEFPYIYYEIGNVQRGEETYTYTLEVNIAGVTKTIEQLRFTEEEDFLKSKVYLRFSDFNLTPPQKLGGAIKIEEEIELDVHLKLTNRLC